jgi:DNA-binding MarR family transcriptional regulator
MVGSIHQQIKKLEADASLIYLLQSKAKTDTGRLTQVGVDMVFACIRGGMSQTDVAKLLDITPSAVSQQAAKMDLRQ